MPDIQSLTLPEILVPDTFEEVYREGLDLLADANGQTSKFIETLEGKLQNPFDVNVGSANEKELRLLLMKLRFRMIRTLTINDILRLLESHLGSVLEFDREGFDLILNLRTFIRGNIVDWEDRDAVKKRFLDSLTRNKEVITQNILRDDGEIEGSLGDWMRYLIAKFNVFPVVSALEISKFKTQDRAFNRLLSDEKKKILNLFNLYLYLKMPSFTPQGLDEEGILIVGDKAYDYDRGEMYDIETGEKVDVTTVYDIAQKLKKNGGVASPQKPKLPAGLPSLPTAPTFKTSAVNFSGNVTDYRGSAEEQTLIAESENEILGDAHDLKHALMNYVFDAMNPKTGYNPNMIKTIASLRLLAKNGWLDDMLREVKIAREFEKYLREVKKDADALQSYTILPGTPRNLQIFLEYLFVHRLKQSVPQACMVGMQISKISQKSGIKKYAQLSFFDMQTNAFVWMKK